MTMDRDRRTDASLPLRPVEFHILLSVAAGERHGYGIIQDASARGEVIDVGTLYRALARMADQGLIAASKRRHAADANDERRNYYRITPRGHSVARVEAVRVASLANAARELGLLKGVTA